MPAMATRSLPVAVPDLPTPALVVDLAAFRDNLAAAEAMVAGTGKVLRPHVKTHRTPGLALLQLGPVARGVTCATVGEAEAMVAVGIDDVLLANEIVATGKVERLVALADRAMVTVAVDSSAGLELLSSAARRSAFEVGVLVELDVGLGRCGVPDGPAAVELARAVVRAPGVRLAGLMGYEGRLRATDLRRPDRIRQASTTLAEARAALEEAGCEVPTVSTAGTSTLREALADPTATEIQAGTYALWESDLDGLGLPFREAVTVVAGVISCRPGRVVLDAGRKSIGSDYGEPVPVGPGRVDGFHEEHTVLAWDGPLPELGSTVALRPRHVRTTFNLHDQVWLAEDGAIVDRLPVSARGRSA